MSSVTSEGSQDGILGVIPLFHTYAQTMVMNYTKLVGGRSTQQPRFVLKDVLGAIDRGKPAFLSGVPSMYRALADTRERGIGLPQALNACAKAYDHHVWITSPVSPLPWSNDSSSGWSFSTDTELSH